MSDSAVLWHFGANKKAPFVQLGTFFSQPLPLLLLFLFQFLSWKSADLEFWIRFGHIWQLWREKKKLGFHNISKSQNNDHSPFRFKKRLFCPESFCLQTIVFRKFLLRNYLVHLLFSSFPSQLQLQNNRGLLKRKEEGNLSNLFYKNWMAEQLSMKRYREHPKLQTVVCKHISTCKFLRKIFCFLKMLLWEVCL